MERNSGAMVDLVVVKGATPESNKQKPDLCPKLMVCWGCGQSGHLRNHFFQGRDSFALLVPEVDLTCKALVKRNGINRYRASLDVGIIIN